MEKFLNAIVRFNYTDSKTGLTGIREVKVEAVKPAKTDGMILLNGRDSTRGGDYRSFNVKMEDVKIVG